MSHGHVYVFLGVRNWDFYAVEAPNSDDALVLCLKTKGWLMTEIVYMGRLEGPMLPRDLNNRWDSEPTEPPIVREPNLVFG